MNLKAGLGIIHIKPNRSKNLTNIVYLLHRCGKVEGDTKKYKIFTIVNPLGSSKLPSYLQRWDPKSFTLEQVITSLLHT